MNPAHSSNIWRSGNRHSRKRPTGRKPLARYGAMGSALRERPAPGKHTEKVRLNPRHPGTFMMRQQIGVREHFPVSQYAGSATTILAGEVVRQRRSKGGASPRPEI